jgi:hypothetical protein
MFDGRLRMARDFGVAADFDPRQYGLFPVRIGRANADGSHHTPEELIRLRDGGER